MISKRFLKNAAWLLVFFVIIVIMPGGEAKAYLDPGSGSFIIQILIAGLLGGAITLRLFWGRILVFLRLRDPITLEKEPVDDGDLPNAPEA